MIQYLNMLREIRTTGVRKPTRAKLVSTGEPIDALSLFGRQLRFDLSAGFPAVTTKKLAFRLVAVELAWFLRGGTNVRWLQERNCHIWDQWAGPDGEVGPCYGAQWRAWRGPDGEVVDQIANLVADISAVRDNPLAPPGRRLILTAWNPVDIPKMGLPPCHAFAQFMVTGRKLSCALYMRSADFFLGVPFNIASYALLTHLIAMQTGLEVGDLVHFFGDAHIYTNHLEQVDAQLSREPRALPRLGLWPFHGTDDDLDGLSLFAPESVALDGYDPHPALKGEVAV